jgi:hypothetical protein
MQPETRFARLIAAKGKVRDELLLRTVRALAAKKPPGIDVLGEAANAFAICGASSRASHAA